MVYEWKTNYHPSVPAEVAGRVCEELEKKGELTARNLVDASRPEDAPLHKAFEWNDAIAAEAYREDQARHIISCLIVQPEEIEEEPMAQAFFHTVENRGTAGYRSITTILMDEKGPDALLRTAIGELAGTRKRYMGVVPELDPIFEAIKEAEKRLT